MYFEFRSLIRFVLSRVWPKVPQSESRAPIDDHHFMMISILPRRQRSTILTRAVRLRTTNNPLIVSLVAVLLMIGAGRNVAIAQTSALDHPMLSSPASPVTIGGDNNDYLVHGISNKSFLYIRAKWPTDRDGVTRIPVCWEDPEPAHERQRELFRAAVINTWQLYSAIQFQNWGACDAQDTNAIHIAVGNYWPQSGIGVSIKGKAAGMKMNFSFDGPDEWKFCKAIADACIRKVGIHEMGHALAFMHEQTRNDTPDMCISSQKGEGRVTEGMPGYTTAGTPWDPDSIMNYCNPVWNNNGHLSSLDVLALQKVYGSPKR